jgi:hypothetical protein
MAEILTDGSTSRVLGFGALTAVILGAFDYTGAALTGYARDPEIDEFERKQYLRKNRRRPIEETIAELGEGRGLLCSDTRAIRMLIVQQEYTLLAIKSGGQRGLRQHMASTSRSKAHDQSIFHARV